VLALASWTGHLSVIHRLDLILAANDADSALNLWGFEHTAIAIGLMPVFLIMAEKLLASADSGRPARRSWTAVAAVSGLLVAWLHPWQALMLLGIVAGMPVAKPPRRRYVVLTIPAIATVLPLVYGFVLSRSDASWAAFQQLTIASSGTAPLWALIASFGPLVAFAAFGLRRSRDDGEWMLALWLITCAVVYVAVPEFRRTPSAA
jgi:hypothetical protein